jgi:predicted secreted protein
MHISSLIVVFVCAWWMILFCVLPFGIARDDAIGTGAPQVTNLKKKFVITTLIAFVVTGIIYALAASQIIDFYKIAEQMIEDDYR